MEHQSGQALGGASSGTSSAIAEVSISCEQGLPSVDATWLRGQVSRVVVAMGAGVAAVSLRLVGDRTMADLHGRHCGDPTTTDVLTFAGQSQPQEIDLVLCLDEARRQAACRGHTVERELLLYVVHGLLHCAGHDDHDSDAAAAMHAEEDRLLEAIGVGATFARPAAGGTAP